MHLSGTSSSSPRQRLCELVEEHSPHKPVATQEVHEPVATKAVHRRDPRRLQEHISRFIEEQNPNNPKGSSATS